MKIRSVCILGGSGFIGHALAAQLTSKRISVSIISRHPERHRELLTLPSVTVRNGDIYDFPLLKHEFEKVDAVINLVGILNQGHQHYQRFRTAHVQLAEIVIEACKAAGVKRLLHMSGLHVDEKSPSEYMRSKARAENLVHAEAGDVKVTSFRPSLVFGPRDSFLNRFSALLDQVPLVFPLACGDSRMQPVYVEDVAKCFVRSLEDYRTFGRRYDLCGPRTYTLKQIVEYVAQLKCRKTRVVGLGPFASRLQAQFLQLMPGKPFSVDNYRSLQVDSVCSKGFPEIFGIHPAPMEDIAPRYIAPDYCDGYADYRSRHYKD